MAYEALTPAIFPVAGKLGYYTDGRPHRIRRIGETQALTVEGQNNPPTTQLDADGDSMFAKNSGMTDADTVQGHLSPTLNPTRYGGFYNSAVGGHTIKQALANVKTEIDDRKDTISFERHVVLVLLGINTLYQAIHNQGMTAQQAFDLAKADLTSYHVGRYNAGIISAAFTLTATQNPAYAASHPAIEEARQKLNAWIRVNWRSVLKAGILVDLDADEILGGYEAVLNTTYYQSDRIHWTQEGRKRAAMIIRQQLDNLPLTDPVADPVSQVTDYMMTVESNHSSVSKSGTWTLGEGIYHYSYDTGAYLEFTYSCSRVRLKMPVFPDGGEFDVLIDGQPAGGGNCYATAAGQEIRYDSGDIPAGTHTIRMTKRGTDTSKRIGLDALFYQVAAPLELDNTLLTWKKTGAVSTVTDSARYTNHPGYATSNTGAVLATGAKMETVVTASRFKLLAPKAPDLGTLRFRVTRMADGMIVYDQTFNQNSAAVVKAGYPDTWTAQLDTGALVEASYKLEIIGVAGNSSFDSILTATSGAGSYESRDAGWARVGTWSNSSGSTLYFDSMGLLTTTTGNKISRVILAPAKEITLVAPLFANAGTIGLTVRDSATNEILFTGTRNQNGTASPGSCNIKSGTLPPTTANYLVEVEAVVANIAFDGIEVI